MPIARLMSSIDPDIGESDVPSLSLISFKPKAKPYLPLSLLVAGSQLRFHYPPKHPVSAFALQHSATETFSSTLAWRKGRQDTLTKKLLTQELPPL